MIDESVPVSELVIFIANILVIRILVILHIDAPLLLLIAVVKNMCTLSRSHMNKDSSLRTTYECMHIYILCLIKLYTPVL